MAELWTNAATQRKLWKRVRLWTTDAVEMFFYEFGFFFKFMICIGVNCILLNTNNDLLLVVNFSQEEFNKNILRMFKQRKDSTF